RAIVDGDAKVRVIAAASILAKTARDAEMRRLHGRFPQYGFDEHKGYPTPQHLRALRRYGVCEVYRRSFRPVKLLLENGR
ncbi:MAG: ribonuclease HII, partial [Betaproteobacteria bacterium]